MCLLGSSLDRPPPDPLLPPEPPPMLPLPPPPPTPSTLPPPPPPPPTPLPTPPPPPPLLPVGTSFEPASPSPLPDPPETSRENSCSALFFFLFSASRLSFREKGEENLTIVRFTNPFAARRKTFVSTVCIILTLFGIAQNIGVVCLSVRQSGLNMEEKR